MKTLTASATCVPAAAVLLARLLYVHLSTCPCCPSPMTSRCCKSCKHREAMLKHVLWLFHASICTTGCVRVCSLSATARQQYHPERGRKVTAVSETCRVQNRAKHGHNNSEAMAYLRSKDAEAVHHSPRAKSVSQSCRKCHRRVTSNTRAIELAWSCTSCSPSAQTVCPHAQLKCKRTAGPDHVQPS